MNPYKVYLLLQPDDQLEVHPWSGGADQGLPGRLQRGGAPAVVAVL